jgi:prolyl-tRNA synthetase
LFCTNNSQTMSREEVLRGGSEAETTATSVAAKTLCKPFEQPALPEGTKCFVSGLPATTWVLWGRSY